MIITEEPIYVGGVVLTTQTYKPENSPRPRNFFVGMYVPNGRALVISQRIIMQLGRFEGDSPEELYYKVTAEDTLLETYPNEVVGDERYEFCNLDTYTGNTAHFQGRRETVRLIMEAIVFTPERPLKINHTALVDLKEGLYDVRDVGFDVKSWPTNKEFFGPLSTEDL